MWLNDMICVLCCDVLYYIHCSDQRHLFPLIDSVDLHSEQDQLMIVEEILSRYQYILLKI